MAQKTSGEIEKEFVANLNKLTGNDLDDWLKMIEKSGFEMRADIIKFLKERNGFGHMNATLLAGIYLNGGKPVYGSTEDLFENQMARAPELRPLYESFIEFVLEEFPVSAILPKKTYISVLEKREFAAINIKKSELRIGLDLGERAFDELVSKSKLTGPMPRISHQFVLTNPSQLNKKLAQLLKDSYNRSN